MQEITAAHEEQIINMRKDGKTYEEIRDFFKKQYGLKIYDNYIAKVQAGKGKFTGKQSLEDLNDGPRKGKRKYTRKLHNPMPIKKAGPSEEFVQHIHAAYNIHKADFVTRVTDVLAEVGA